MEFRILIVTVIIMIIVDRSHSSNWDYERFGPDVWSKFYPKCADHSQSPIDIKTMCTIQQTFQQFNFTPNYNQTFKFTLLNDGHTIKTISDSTKFLLNGANLEGNYQFVNFHLHWGPNENVGSEHQVNGLKYTGECHFVYEHVKIPTMMTVLAFFMKIKSNSFDEQNKKRSSINTEWHKYFLAGKYLTKENNSIIIDLNLSLLMGNNLNDFWRYNGSLTIPNCSQNVIWTVFKEPIYIHEDEFEKFRNNLFIKNYRSPQPLYNRKIYRSFQHEDLSPIPSDGICCYNKTSKGNFMFLEKNSIYFYLFYINFIWIFI